MNKDTGGPAFPQSIREIDGSTTYWHGMTLRDYFAAKAMQEFCKEFNDDAHLAKIAYQIADAMLKAREQ